MQTGFLTRLLQAYDYDQAYDYPVVFIHDFTLLRESHDFTLMSLHP
jgi:hypothetical protein